MEALLGTIITYTKGNWQGRMSILGIVLSAYTRFPSKFKQNERHCLFKMGSNQW